MGVVRVYGDGAVAFEYGSYGVEDAVTDNHVFALPLKMLVVHLELKSFCSRGLQSFVPLGVLS